MTWEEIEAQTEREHAAQLARVRAAVDDHGGTIHEQHLTYHIGPNMRETRAEYPWRVTYFHHDPQTGELIPAGHTEHRALDLPEDHGCYYRSAVWEVASQITGAPTYDA